MHRAGGRGREKMMIASLWADMDMYVVRRVVCERVEERWLMREGFCNLREYRFRGVMAPNRTFEKD